MKLLFLLFFLNITLFYSFGFYTIKSNIFQKSIKLKFNNNIDDPDIYNINIYKNKINEIEKFIKISGLSLGIPLNIICYFNLFYNANIDNFNFKVLIFNFLIGSYTYGYDRLRDAINYNLLELNNTKSLSDDKINNYNMILSNKPYYKLYFEIINQIIIIILLSANDNNYLKALISSFLYKYLISNKLKNIEFTFSLALFNNLIQKIINIINFCTITLFIYFDNLKFLPILFLLETTNYYIYIKKNINLIKPFYVSFLWTINTVLIPLILNSNLHFNILIIKDLILNFILIFSLTNIADLLDIEDDIKNNIKTIPILIGKNYTIILSAILFIINFIIYNI